MHTPRRPSSSPSSRAGAAARESDESLAAQLRARPEGDDAHPAAVLLASHWQPVHDYAAICAASTASAAPIVAAAAFHQVLDRLVRGESAVALRPRLLTAVRDTVKAWSGEPHIAALIPELRKPTGGRGMRAARSITAENRRLAHRSFQALPGVAQCLLWHTEVEAEAISVPAGLLGMDDLAATDTLGQSREQFRAGCVRAHRELAPSKECRSYNRLLDVSIGRGDVLLPDIQQHLAGCRYCRHAAEQLAHFQGPLGSLLAEAVLGWGARRYLDSRPGRVARGLVPGGPPVPGRHRLLPHIATLGGQFTLPRRGAKAWLGGVGVVGVALLVAALAGGLLSDSGAGRQTASSGATGAQAASSSPTADGPTATASTGFPGASVPARLRNVAAGLCLDIRGGTAENGAGTEMTECSSDTTQRWSYEDDGLLRSFADPDLCLDSHENDGLVSLAPCVGPSAANADDVRYDLTVRGELLPRGHQGLAVAPTSAHPGVDVAAEPRHGSAAQRWLLDTGTIASGSRSVAGATPPSPGAPTDGPKPGPVCTAAGCAPSRGGRTKEPKDPDPSVGGAPPGQYEVRRLETGDRGPAGPVAAERPGAAAGTLVARVAGCCYWNAAVGPLSSRSPLRKR